MSNIAKPHVEIKNDVRKYLREYGANFPTAMGFEGFSEALQERETELIDELTSFWLDIQEESLNPSRSENNVD